MSNPPPQIGYTPYSQAPPQYSDPSYQPAGYHQPYPQPYTQQPQPTYSQPQSGQGKISIYTNQMTISLS